MMNSVSYDPQELLIALMEIDKKLKLTMAKHCPDQNISIDDDLDKVWDDFFELQGVRNNEIGYVSTQLAILHLRREVEKTMEVVVQTNSLRAIRDFNLAIKEENLAIPAVEKQWKPGKLILAAIMGCLAVIVLYFLFIRS